MQHGPSSLNAQPEQATGQLHLHFCHVSRLSSTEEQAVVECLSSSEIERLESFKHPNRRVEYLVSRRLMRDALCEQFGENPEYWDFDDRRGEVPQIRNLPDRHHVNLSHSKGLVCFAIADAQMGVDIEAQRAERDYSRLAKMFMTGREREALNHQVDPSTYFYRCWCAKEAYYKAHTKAEQSALHFTGIEVSDLDQAQDWQLVEGRIDEHYLVAATRQGSVTTHCHYHSTDAEWSRPFVPAHL